MFQIVGGTLFLAMMFVCCSSGLLSREWATRDHLQRTGWQLHSVDPDRPGYSAQRAMSLGVTCGVFFGLALAGVGLGLQAERRGAGAGAIVVAIVGSAFWCVHAVFAVQFMPRAIVVVPTVLLAAVFLLLLGLSVPAAVQMWRNPPPPGHDILPKGYKIPYSHYHDDPPEVRLAAELEARRERLEVQRKELEALERKVQRRIDDAKPPSSDST